MSSQASADWRNRKLAVKVRATQLWVRSGEAALEVPDNPTSSERSGMPLNIIGLMPNTVPVNPERINKTCEERDVNPSDTGLIEMAMQPDEREDMEDQSIQYPSPPLETSFDVALSLESDCDDAGNVINSPDINLQVQSQAGESNEDSAVVEAEEKYRSALLFYLNIMYHMCIWPCDIKMKHHHWIWERLHQVM